MVIIELKQAFIASILTLPLSLYANERTFSITIDNDGPLGTDRDYTNGLLFNYSNVINNKNSPLITYSPLTWISHPKNSHYKWNVTIGHKMWTPSNIMVQDPLPNERPYSGVLYAQTDLISILPTSTHSIGLLLGVIGPNSYAEQAQVFVHDITGSDTPEGWEYQIENSALANVIYNGNLPVSSFEYSDNYSTEWSIPLRAMAGNYRSELAVGTIWRWGTNLQNSLGSVTTENEMTFKPYMVRSGGSGAFIYSGVETRYRFNDITIDGDRPDEVYKTDVENWQATAVLGGTIYGKTMGGSAAVAIKTRDFKQYQYSHSANVSLSLFWIF